MLPVQARRKADVVVSCLFMGLGSLVIYRASLMPWSSTRMGGSEAQWFLSPGLFPATIGTLLILFSARVLISAIREGGHQDILPAFRLWLAGLRANRRIHNVVVITLLIGLYIFLGVGRLNFQLMSAIFLLASIAFFWWRDAGPDLLRRIAVTIAVAVLVPVIITFLFSNFLYVPMP